MPITSRNKVLLRGEQSNSAVAIVEQTMPAGAPGPPLHSHAFDEAFYILDGELTIQLHNKQTTAKAGELTFAPRGVPHTLANPTATPARYYPGRIRTPIRAARRQRSRSRATEMGAAIHPRSHLPRTTERRETGVTGVSSKRPGLAQIPRPNKCSLDDPAQTSVTSP